jgi:chromosome segregation ATPase
MDKHKELRQRRYREASEMSESLSPEKAKTYKEINEHLTQEHDFTIEALADAQKTIAKIREDAKKDKDDKRAAMAQMEEMKQSLVTARDQNVQKDRIITGLRGEIETLKIREDAKKRAAMAEMAEMKKSLATAEDQNVQKDGIITGLRKEIESLKTSLRLTGLNCFILVCAVVIALEHANSR